MDEFTDGQDMTEDTDQIIMIRKISDQKQNHLN